MRQPRVFGNGPGFKPMVMAPVFGEVKYEIVIQTDGNGLMKTIVTKYPEGQPPTQIQMMGMFLDGMNGQFQAMIAASSMIVNANGKGLPSATPEESNNGDRGVTGEPNNGS